MQKQEHSTSTKGTTSPHLEYKTGPFSGKVCYIDKADRLRIKIELGFNVAVVAEMKLLNLNLKGLSRDILQDVKSCLVILIGGRNVILDNVADEWDGIRPCRLFVPCSNPPTELHHKHIGEKVYMDIGDFLEHTARPLDFNPDKLKDEYLRRR